MLTKKTNVGLSFCRITAQFAPLILLVSAAISATAQTYPDPVVRPLVIPPSKLLHFDSKIRIPNQYMVRFQDDAILATIDPSALALAIAPQIIPNSEDNVTALAIAISVAYQNKGIPNTIVAIWARAPNVRGFGIKGLSDGDAKELAQDPRIKFIEPDMYANAS